MFQFDSKFSRVRLHAFGHHADSQYSAVDIYEDEEKMCMSSKWNESENDIQVSTMHKPKQE